jgi:tetratricopeptide (TPR) repeat protein
LATALNYVKELNAAGKIIEARYYFERLAVLKPNNAQVVRLGYELAVKAFDKEAMKRYDLALFDSKPKRGELLTYRLMLYFANNNAPLCLECARELLRYDVGDEAMRLVVDVIFKYRCPYLTIEFVKFLAARKLQPHGQTVQVMKRILIERLLAILEGKLHA